MELAAELRAGLRAARPFLLSHDTPPYEHCHALRVRGRSVHVCARCLGIYPGVAAGLLAAATVGVPLVAVAALPALALADWASVAFTDRTGDNRRRTATGVLLGAAVGAGLRRSLAGDPRALVVGFAYASLAAAGLWLARDSE